MARCLGIELIDAWIPVDATIGDAANRLARTRASALAVIEDDRRVAGTFGHLDLVRCVFPAYLGELRHTAGLRDDAEALARRVAERAHDPLPPRTRPPITLEVDSSALHVAELFLHTGLPSLPVVQDARFVGMLELRRFSRAIVDGRAS